MRHLLGFLRQPLTLASLCFAVVALLIVARPQWFDLDFHMAGESRHLKVEDAVVVGVLLLLGVALLWNRSLAAAHQLTTRAEAEARRIAYHDPLTGLPNRRAFHRHVAEVTARAGEGAEPGGRALAVLLLDLDRFKPVNDLRGHAAGDLLLAQVAARLRAACPPRALVARLGGDEFVIAIDGPDADADRGAALARRVNAALSMPFDFGDWSATVSCSVGIAVCAGGTTSADLLRRADQAMYRAKQAGRGRHLHYDDALGEALREQAALEQDLRRALDGGTILPHFQPIFDITSHALRGFEVLARWPDPVRGFVPPVVFVDLAEELGLIDRLSELVLDQACAALVQWPTELPISFNLSPRQFSDPSLPGRVLAVLARHGLPGSRLEIEITERAVLGDLAVARAIVEEFAAAGVRVSLDDFGIGTSSLATLTTLPIDRIKIDRSFIAQVDRLPDRAKLVSGVLALAESLGIEVTAEGIERREELAFLQARNCALGQGYLLGRPQPAEAIAGLLAVAAPSQGAEPAMWTEGVG